MVHVLRQLHKTLRPRGVLLDVHPLPRHPRVEIWRSGRRTSLGHLDDTLGIHQIRAARARLAAIVREVLFQVGARRWFDWRVHYSSVEAWLRRREERNSTSVIPTGLLPRVRREMRTPGSTLVIGERTRAAVLMKVR